MVKFARLFKRVVNIPMYFENKRRFDRTFDLMHSQTAKRAVDILGGIVGLILAAPLILVFGILIYLESPGPIFYVQRRETVNRRVFCMYKLRSMGVDAEKESGPVWPKRDDDRLLRIGVFMRKYNIDETPQFWNVLKGEMSLVGPRPERPEFVEIFNQTIEHYNLRHACKAGMTGWAVIHGLRGDTSLEERLKYDLDYIENWSVLLDIYILLLTPFALLRTSNVY